MVIANPINLLVADQAGVGFNRYWIHMAPAAVVCWVVTWAILATLFRRELGSVERPDPPQARWEALPLDRRR